MDFQDQPTAKSIPWKPVAIAAVGVVVVVVLIFVIVRWIKKDAQMEALSEILQEDVVSSLDSCDSAENPESCKQAKVTDLATKHQSVQTCELLETAEARDNCYWSVAQASSDVSYCDTISVEEDASKCFDGVNLQLAFDSNDGGYCSNMKDAGRKANCEELFAGPITIENCNERAPELCGDLAYYTQARRNLDVSLCQEIVDEDLREACQEIVSDRLLAQEAQAGADLDDDGLTTQEESQYGTDPLNPDTDEDGYLDGAEVSAGYNPLGAGRL
ncbi:hypothetical protein HZA87_06145 [Candidatus Uhrbacteria bacterium]|nr:hypothetical protein [Candidatus Uhrbacteria bacterium]